jgi:phosphoglycolate phosphatase
VVGRHPPLVFSEVVNTSVIWDWNGTLLDDVDICIASANRLLARRGLQAMTRDRYRRVFTFPVQTYYEEMGFDFSAESFADVAVEYHDAYESLVRGAKLHADAILVLEKLKDLGFDQVVLSALEEGRLRNELRVREIDHYFTHAYGLSDLHARSKTARGEELLRELGSTGDGWWMIGDTDHDAEVASALGVSCILVACGHHSEDRLKPTGARVVADLTEALSILSAEVTGGSGPD